MTTPFKCPSAPDNIRIKKVTDDVFIVETTFANGWQQVQRCNSEEQARVYVAGFRDGLASVRNMIGNGLHFTAQVEIVEPKNSGDAHLAAWDEIKKNRRTKS